MKTETILPITVRQLADRRFRVSYRWSIWENLCRQYFNDEEEVGKFISELVKNTRWRYEK
jgi:hypothetical protein